ncbi:TPA: hypothetical protein N0F65_012466 [Lagenidium giganteum]|uniref:Galactose oxidase n=1 Tax=Lagenidium giganteum TaxID=4803 RepID=A0AAV2YGP9_9STRA|nr:TPA: hypothetical protein N0F65_012466 [Lagenidium giganteum]
MALVNDIDITPTPREHHSTALHTNAYVAEIIVFGGVNFGSINVTVWSISVVVCNDSNTDTPLDEGQCDQCDGSSSAAAFPGHSRRLIIFGGITYNYSSSTMALVDYNDPWSYDLGTRQWRPIEPANDLVPPTRLSHSASLLTNHNNACSSGWSALDDVWLFSFDERVWLPVTTSSSLQRAYTSVIVQDSTMWLFGGYKQSGLGQNASVVNDVVSGNVTVINSTARTASMDLVQFSVPSGQSAPEPRYGHQAVLLHHQMVIHGGSFRGDVWSYSFGSFSSANTSSSPSKNASTFI